MKSKKKRDHADNLTPFRSTDGKRVGKKVFSVRVPEKYEEYLLSLDSKTKTTFIRNAIIDAIEKRL